MFTYRKGKSRDAIVSFQSGITRNIVKAVREKSGISLLDRLHHCRFSLAACLHTNPVMHGQVMTSLLGHGWATIFHNVAASLLPMSRDGFKWGSRRMHVPTLQAERVPFRKGYTPFCFSAFELAHET